MKAVAIITARGGSRRIPRKNIREFCGKPIIAYSIEAALGAGVFDTVMVSTDDEEQLTSYEAQQTYYTDKIMTNPQWTMAGIFADEGITGHFGPEAA